MRLMENGLFVDSAPEGEKQKIIDENPEIMQIWDDETGDRMTSLCIIAVTWTRTRSSPPSMPA